MHFLPAIEWRVWLASPNNITDTDSFGCAIVRRRVGKRDKSEPLSLRCFDFSQISKINFFYIKRYNFYLHAGQVSYYCIETTGNLILNFICMHSKTYLFIVCDSYELIVEANYPMDITQKAVANGVARY